MEWILTGNSPPLLKLLERCAIAARSVLPILIEGEEGTGHEAVARHIHALGAPHPCRFLDARKAGLKDALASSAASVFIPDVDRLSRNDQRRLADFIRQELAGNTGPRIFTATAADLVEATRKGHFDQTLFLHLSVMPVRLPPLRERLEDIGPLAAALLRRPGSGRQRVALSAESLDLMKRHAWPDNLAGLQSCLERALAAAGEGPIEPQHLPPAISACGPGSGPQGQLSRPVRFSAARPARSQGTPSIPALDQAGELRTLEEIEADVIRIALACCRGHMSEAARRLGVGRSTLYRKVRALGLKAYMAKA